MSGMEIVLIVLGVAVFIASFFIPGGKNEIDLSDDEALKAKKEELSTAIQGELEDARSNIGDMVDETINYGMEKAERSMERLTNEKIMAVSEYSDTVLEQINKTHKEVVFLYDMLNDKHENIKETVSEAAKRADEVKRTVQDAEITARETRETVESMVSTVEPVDFDPMPVNRIEIVKEEIAAMEKMMGDPTEAIEPVATEDASEFTLPDLQVEEKPAVSEKKSVKSVKKTTTKKTSAKTSKEKKKDEKPTGQAPQLAFLSNGEGSMNNNDRILELHEAGKSNMAIAKELGLGIGEVKLVIDLFENM